MTVAALALSVALAASASPAPPPAACKPQLIRKTTALAFPDGKTIRANVVDTPRSREIGMMCLTRVGGDYGMLFVFPREMELNFWMKNTLVSLDIVWIGADKTVTVVHERMKKSTVDTPDDQVAAAGGRGQYVLELPAGAAAKRGLKPGDRIAFEAAIPEK